MNKRFDWSELEPYKVGKEQGKEQAKKEFIELIEELLEDVINENDRTMVIEGRYVIFSGVVQDLIRELKKEVERKCERQGSIARISRPKAGKPESPP